MKAQKALTWVGIISILLACSGGGIAFCRMFPEVAIGIGLCVLFLLVISFLSIAAALSVEGRAK